MRHSAHRFSRSSSTRRRWTLARANSTSQSAWLNSRSSRKFLRASISLRRRKADLVYLSLIARRMRRMSQNPSSIIAFQSAMSTCVNGAVKKKTGNKKQTTRQSSLTTRTRYKPNSKLRSSWHENQLQKGMLQQQLPQACLKLWLSVYAYRLSSVLQTRT